MWVLEKNGGTMFFFHLRENMILVFGFIEIARNRFRSPAQSALSLSTCCDAISTSVSGIMICKKRRPFARPAKRKIRIGRDQNAADGLDKLLDLWIADGANAWIHPYRQNLLSFRERNKKKEVKFTRKTLAT